MDYFRNADYAYRVLYVGNTGGLNYIYANGAFSQPVFYLTSSVNYASTVALPLIRLLINLIDGQFEKHQ